MPLPLPLRCTCGAVRGELDDASPAVGNRMVCYCDDCQDYTRFLGRADALDPFGGSDIYQTTPSRVRITQGAEHLRIVRLSEKGMVRYYAGCCRTPIGNLMAGARWPFVGLAQPFMDHAADGRSRDERLGPAAGYIHGRYAPGGCPPHAHPSASVAVIGRAMWRILLNMAHGSARPTPFYDDQGKLVSEPQVLSPQERDALRRPPASA
ncbi:MAG: DUF6151 family protein [Myxococcota bacterium]